MQDIVKVMEGFITHIWSLHLFIIKKQKNITAYLKKKFVQSGKGT